MAMICGRNQSLSFRGLTRLRATRTTFIALGVGIAALAASPDEAFAISAGCTSINAGLFNRSVPFMLGGPTTQTQALDFERNEVLTISWTIQSGLLEFEVNAVLVVNESGTSVPGNQTYTFASTGNYTLSTTMNGATGNTTVTVTCTPVPDEPVDPDDPDGPGARLHMGYVLFPTVLTNFNPESLPGTTQSGGQEDSFSSLQHLLPTTAQAGSNVPWPTAATAYGEDDGPVQNISAGGEQQMMLGGIPMTGWIRAKGFIYDGAFNTRGGAGQFMGGAVFGVTDAVDIGVFGHIAASEIESVPLGGELDSVLGGVGGYAKVDLPERMRAGLSVVHTWGSHDIVAGGASGEFDSRHWTIEGSLARPYDLSGFVVTPMALITYRHHLFGGYVGSNGAAVPGVSDSTLDLSAVADVAYPMARDGNVVKTITPRVTVRTNFHVQRFDVVAANPLLVDQSRFSVDLSGGLVLGLQNGGNLDFTAGATGLASDLRAYTFRGTFSIPLN
jgi:PKD repeat protein